MGELVEHGHVHPGVVLHYVVHEAGPDEAAATDDDDVGGFEGHKDWCHATCERALQQVRSRDV